MAHLSHFMDTATYNAINRPMVDYGQPLTDYQTYDDHQPVYVVSDSLCELRKIDPEQKDKYSEMMEFVKYVGSKIMHYYGKVFKLSSIDDLEFNIKTFGFYLPASDGTVYFYDNGLVMFQHMSGQLFEIYSSWGIWTNVNVVQKNQLESNQWQAAIIQRRQQEMEKSKLSQLATSALNGIANAFTVQRRY